MNQFYVMEGMFVSFEESFIKELLDFTDAFLFLHSVYVKIKEKLLQFYQRLIVIISSHLLKKEWLNCQDVQTVKKNGVGNIR